MPNEALTRNVLAAVDVFSNLTDGELKIVEKASKEVIYTANKVIFREGEPGDKMFLIKQGVVEIWKSDGRELKGSRLARLKENEIFGEMAIFDKEPRSASAYAVINDETKIYVWEEKEIRRMIEQNPALGVKLLDNVLRKLSSRLRNANEAIHTLLRANRYIGL